MMTFFYYMQNENNKFSDKFHASEARACEKLLRCTYAQTIETIAAHERTLLQFLLLTTFRFLLLSSIEKSSTHHRNENEIERGEQRAKNARTSLLLVTI